jgi:hypothetical protein
MFRSYDHLNVEIYLLGFNKPITIVIHVDNQYSNNNGSVVSRACSRKYVYLKMVV